MKPKVYILMGQALMLIAGLLFVGLLWRVWLRPLWSQYQTRSIFETAMPTTAMETPTQTLMPLVLPTNLPESVFTATPMPTWTATPIPRGDYQLVVPSINLRWLVHHITPEEENNELWGIPKTILDQYGVVDYPHLAFPGEEGIVGIAGHRDMSGNPFWSIDKINVGDLVILQRQDGEELTYIVYLILTVVPDDPIFWEMQYLEETRLVSCLIGSTKYRIIVFAYRQR